MTKKILLVFLLCSTANFSLLYSVKDKKDQKSLSWSELFCPLILATLGYAVGSCINNNDSLIPISEDTQKVLPLAGAAIGSAVGGALPRLWKEKKD
jgi:hypothetical protein